MKKKFAIALTALLAAFMTLSLAACGLFRSGADDNFPYDVIVKDGYTGTEAEWLAEQESGGTIYRRMWEEAVADGSFTGTYFEFLQQLNITQDDTPYIQRALCSVVAIESYFSDTDGSAGSGVIYSLDRASGDAYIVTNYHVVYNSSGRQKISNNISLWLYGWETASGTLSATFYGGSMESDIAVLRVEGDDVVKEDSLGTKTHTNKEVLQASSAMPVIAGDSDNLTVSERVYAIGNPEDWGISVASGTVSVDAEYITMSTLDGSGEVTMLEIRTDAAVNHGNSGGGLFNAAGELVGIVNARSEMEGVVGFGYAIPVNRAFAIARNILDNGGTFKSARLGIYVKTEEMKSVYNEVTGKTYIEEKIVVQSTSDSSIFRNKEKLDVGDTLVSVTLNGRTVAITRQHKLSNLLLDVRRGDTVTLVVSRNGEKLTLQVTFDKDSYFVSN